MISSVRGKIIFKYQNKIEIDVGGVGWDVYLPQTEILKLEVGCAIEIFIYQHIAEEKNDLYGFMRREDKQVFEMLLGVSGVGPKTALGIFTVGNGERIVKAVAEAEVEFFRQVKGLGGKGAQRIIVDLKGKVGGLKDLDLSAETESNESIYQALMGLGFRKEEIKKVVPKIPIELQNETERLKWALKNLGK